MGGHEAIWEGAEGRGLDGRRGLQFEWRIWMAGIQGMMGLARCKVSKVWVLIGSRCIGSGEKRSPGQCGGVSYGLERLCFQEIPGQVSRLILELVPGLWPHVGNNSSLLWDIYCIWFSWSRVHLQCDLIVLELRTAFYPQLEATNPLVQRGSSDAFNWQVRIWTSEFSVQHAPVGHQAVSRSTSMLRWFLLSNWALVRCKIKWGALLFRFCSTGGEPGSYLSMVFKFLLGGK